MITSTRGLVSLIVVLALVGKPLAARDGFAADGLLSRLRDGSDENELRERAIERIEEHLGRTSAPGARRSLRIGGVHVTLWQPSLGGAAGYPLVVFSHGLHGSSLQSKFLARALALAGYLVVAPDHRDSNRELGGPLFGPHEQVGPPRPLVWTDAIYRDRANDVSAVLTALHADSRWAGKIDWSRVGLAGHSLGGYTVLGLAGAWPSWKLPAIKAVLALSPHVSPFVHAGTLGMVGVPVMYQTGTRDLGVRPSIALRGGAYDLTPAPVYMVDIENAGHFSWSDVAPGCHSTIVAYALAFFDTYLKGIDSPLLARRGPGVVELRSRR